MIMTYQPLSLVENSYFRDWVSSLSNNIKNYGRRGITDGLSRLANIMRQKIKGRIANKYVAITGDKWSSIGHQSYLGLTCHFIDDDWKLQT
jgi:hypothetical protein